jgi:hypothetical protein
MSQESSLLQPSRRDPNRVLPRGTPSPPLLVREKSAHRDHTDLDNRAAEITVEHFQPAIPRERICRRAKDRLVKARGRRRAVTSARRAPEMRVSLSSRRTSPLVFDRTQNNQALHVDATAGGGRSSETSRRISANKILGMTTSAIWKARERPWLTTFAPISMSLSLRVVSDKSLIVSGVGSVRRQLPRL